MKSEVKKIVIVFNNLNIGGIETKIVDLCRYYSQQKNTRLYLLLKSTAGPLLPSIPQNIIIKSPKIPEYLKIKSWSFPFWLYSSLKTIKPHLVLAFGNYSSISSALALRFSKLNSHFLISEDSSILDEIKNSTFPKLRKKLITITYPQADKIIVLSTTGQQKLYQLLPTLKTKAIILKNWLPLSSPISTTYPQKDIDLLFLGRFESQKNPHEFLKISRQLLTKSKIKIAMVGYGSLETKIKTYVNKYHLNISLYPKTTEAYKFYQRSKILLLSSSHEGFPLTVLESSANACLPFCKNLSEITDYFDYNSSQITYNLVSEALTKIKYLLKHPTLLKQLTSYYQQKTIRHQKIAFQKTINFLSQYL